MVSNDFKGRCEKATRFIESCFDNNDDGLTFDERVNQRKNELPADIRSIVDDAQHYDDVATPENIESDDDLEEIELEDYEKDCDCDCVQDVNGGHVPPHELVLYVSETRGAYKDRKRALKQTQADLRLNTDWSKAIPDKPRPTEKDKEAWIFLETLPLQEEVDDLENEYSYLSELWKLEKIMLKQVE